MLNQFNKKLGGSTQKFIALGKIRELDILVPKYKEQQKISEILSSVDKKLEKQKELKEKLTQLKKGLMSDLLSGKVRVIN
jgi:type I restriction enzyme S subunit